MTEAKPWRWTCPHCGGGSMRLNSAVKHLLRKHSACFGCHLERYVVEAILDGRGWVSDNLHHWDPLTSRAGD